MIDKHPEQKDDLEQKVDAGEADTKKMRSQRGRLRLALSALKEQIETTETQIARLVGENEALSSQFDEKSFNFLKLNEFKKSMQENAKIAKSLEHLMGAIGTTDRRFE